MFMGRVLFRVSCLMHTKLLLCNPWSAGCPCIQKKTRRLNGTKCSHSSSWRKYVMIKCWTSLNEPVPVRQSLTCHWTEQCLWPSQRQDQILTATLQLMRTLQRNANWNYFRVPIFQMTWWCQYCSDVKNQRQLQKCTCLHSFITQQYWSSIGFIGKNSRNYFQERSTTT